MIEDRQRWSDRALKELQSNTVPLTVAPCQLTTALSLFHPPVPTLGESNECVYMRTALLQVVLIPIKFLF